MAKLSLTSGTLVATLILSAAAARAQAAPATCPSAADAPSGTIAERAELASDTKSRVDLLPAAKEEEFRARCGAVAAFIAAPFSADVQAPRREQLEAASLIAKELAPRGSVGTVDRDNLENVSYSPDESTAGGAAAWLNPTAFAIGAADFVVERAKDELVYSFVTNLGDDVSRIPLFRIGFPRSVTLMDEIQVGTFQSLMPVVRLAVAQDLQEFPAKLMNDTVVKALGLAEERPYLAALALLYQHGLEIHRGVAPAVALGRLADDAAVVALTPGSPARVILRLTGQIAQEYGASDPEDLRDFLEDGEKREWFAAFAVADLLKAENLARTDVRGRSILQSFDEKHGTLLQLVQQFEAARNAIQQAQQSTGSTADRAARYIDASAAVLQTASIGLGLLPSSLSTATETVSELKVWLDLGIQLHQQLIARDYQGLITWMLGDQRIRNALGPTGTTYLVFAANLASADTPDEVTSVLEAASAPVGSYRAKRNQAERPADWDWVRFATSPRSYGPASLGITAFLGGQYGSERTSGLAGGEDTDDFYGLSLPIGIEASWGLPFGSASAFLSVFDLGAFATRRENDQAVKDDAELGWNQIIAPGLYGLVGFRGIPVVLGYGVQRVSDLRESADGSQTVDVYRSALFLAVDVTLFRLF